MTNKRKPQAGPAEDAAFHLAAIVASSADAIIGKTLDGVITSWNKGAERIFGYSAHEVIGRNVSILIPPERLGEETRILKQIGNGERIEHYQTVRRRKDGSHIDIALTVSPIKDAGGRIVGASKIARDISEHVRDQELRQRGDELLRVTLSSIGDAVVSTDHEGRVTFMNPVAERLTGWTWQEAVGNSLEQSFRIVDEPTRQPVPNPVTRVLRTGAVIGLDNDTVLISKDGTERPIDDSAAPIRNANGDVIGVVLVFRDVTARKRAEAALRESEALKTGMLNAGLDAIIMINQATEVVEFNAAAERIFGYARQDTIGRRVDELIVPPQLREAHTRGVTRYLATGESHILGRRVEMSAMRSDGSEFPCELAIFRVPLEGPPLFTASLRDITERKRAEEAVRESEEQFRTLADNIAQFAWIADEKGSIFWYNKRWYEYTGTTLEDVQGWGWKKLHHPDHVERVVAHIQASWDTGQPWEDVFPLRGKDGGYRWFLSRALPIRDAAGQVVRWLGTNTDVTEQRAAEDALRHGALHDSLTDLPNRAYFVAQLSQAFVRMRRDPDYRIAVLLLDCDGFKAINDTLGHVAGDRFLTEIGGRLRASVRPGDVVARLGGDEFTVLLEEVTGASDAEQAARHIQEALATPLTLDGREVVATVSIGAALSEADDEQPQDLLHHADLAMYHAKRQGCARFQMFDAALRDSAQARLAMETDLRNAVERQQLRLVFQPIVELETGRVRSVEALLRWDGPQRDVVTPLDIVAFAEQTGLILPIGRWVLREACRYARSWQDASPAAAPVRVNVNLSDKQFGDPDLVEEVRTAVQDSGVRFSCLILEIAERVLVANVESSRAVLQRLRELGVEVHIDDFGTASSLIFLSRFPVQGIKLDRALVRRMGARRTEQFAIVRSIVDLARSLGLGITAEGVETVAQRERLIALGCELGQGYLFAKPLEPEAVGALLAEAA